MVNYNNSCIFIYLCCNDFSITNIYIGSTTNFNRRKQAHKFNCHNSNSKEYENYKYQFINNNGGWNNWSMIEIEKVNVSDKRELEKKEREHIEMYKASLNKRVPTRTNKEYYESNKDMKKKYQGEYIKLNKDKLRQKINCNCGVNYLYTHKARHFKLNTFIIIQIINFFNLIF